MADAMAAASIPIASELARMEDWTSASPPAWASSVRVSPVLDAVARALQLDDVEKQHLFALAKPQQQPARPTTIEAPRPGLLAMLANIRNVPAVLLDHRLDVLAMNTLGQAFHVEIDAVSTDRQNLARYVFQSAAARAFYIDWAESGREIVGMLNLSASHHPQDADLTELIAELSESDEDFRRWWRDRDVFRPRHGTKRYRHPLVGDLELGYEAFNPIGDEDQLLGIYTVEPGSSSEDALARLAGP
ncbi:transcriptional regulator [Mycobacterium aquaticum]|nr:transcriptional regulator [Mycobacterium aquaticum]